MHLNFSPHRNISNNLILGGCSFDAIYSVSYDSLDFGPSLCEENEITLSEMWYPYISSRYAVEMLGSCNGLVCLMYNFRSFSGNGNGSGFCTKFFFCIWNPATHEYKKVGEPTNKIAFENIGIYDFGCDYKNDDYKLVIGLNSTHTGSVVQVYTLGSDSWGSFITIPYFFYSNRKSGVLVNGNIHWLAEQGRLIVSLDISDERFKVMEVPIELRENGHWFITAAVLEGYLCVLVVFDTDTDDYGDGSDDDDGGDDDHGPVEVWVMQDYGVRESWIKRYIITHEIIARNIMHHSFSLRFMWFSKNGQILITESGKLVLYDPKDGNAIERGMGRARGFRSEASYSESLVSVNSGTYARKGHIEEPIETENPKKKNMRMDWFLISCVQLTRYSLQ
ncbi:F-box/kelch-repeat protein At3g06240-like [Papaver somniferum]|uniref:F-box/kelch-repeat protein At3g06240-like n=1 Tax=Papaver somniferum TaxID=3469 RepID=UPI000E6FE223|nr:F-box/kelch-repeat protein At3g06240-like [Papaver somniferum]